MKVKIIVFIFCFGLLFSACRKKVTWDVGVKAPILKGEMTLANILDTSKLTIASDGVNLSYSDTLSLFTMKTSDIGEIKLNDTLKNAVKTGLPFSISFAPNSKIWESEKDQILKIAPIKLKSMEVERFRVRYRVTNYLKGEFKYKVKFKNSNYLASGLPVEMEMLIPPATSSPAVVEEIFDLKDYKVDLTGSDGNKMNAIKRVQMVYYTDKNAGSISVLPTDSMVFEQIVERFTVKEAKGYFGQKTHNLSGERKFKMFQKIKSGTFFTEDFKMTLLMENTFGLDVKARINQMKAKRQNTVLQLIDNNLIGVDKMLSRIRYSNPFVPTLFRYELIGNSPNSNISNFVSKLPTSLDYSVDLQINPLGNVSGYNDFILGESQLKAKVHVNVNLKMKMNDLTVVDTVEFSNTLMKNIRDGRLYVDFKNMFAFGGVADLLLKNGEHVLSGVKLPMAEYNALDELTKEGVSNQVLTLSKKQIHQLNQQKKLIIKIKFNTKAGEKASIYNGNRISYSLRTSMRYEMNI